MKTTLQTVYKRVKSLIHTCCQIPEEDIKWKSRMTSDLGMSSLQVTAFINQLEEEFQLDLLFVKKKDIATVEQIVTHVLYHGKLEAEADTV